MSTSWKVIVSKAIDFAREKPGWALLFFVLVITVLPGVSSYKSAFWGKASGQDAAISEALAKLQQQTITLSSEIEAEREARIEEIMRLKEDEKLLSKDSIRLMVKEELLVFGDRLILRLKE